MILYRRTTVSNTEYLFMMKNTTLSVMVDHDLSCMSFLFLGNRPKIELTRGFEEVGIDDTNLLAIFKNGNTVIAEIIRRLEE